MALGLGRQQVPILCMQCRGPVPPTNGFTIDCPYCRHKDALPKDEVGRALEIKKRLRAAQNSQDQLSNFASALSSA